MLGDNFEYADTQDLNKDLILAIRHKNANKAIWLLEQGADPYAKDQYENSALLLAIQYNCIEIIERLISQVDVNDPRNFIHSRTPLMLAARDGDIQAIMLLVKAGAEINVKDKQGKTAAFYAVANEHYEAAELLEQNGAIFSALEKRLIELNNRKKLWKEMDLEISHQTESAIKGATNRIQELSFKKGQAQATALEERELYTLARSTRSNPVLSRKKLEWEWITRSASSSQRDRYLEKFKKIEYKVKDETLELYDLTEADDYRFVVHGFSCNLKNLNELVNGERQIIEQSCYISASLIDKKTAVCNSIDYTPIYLVLEMHPDSIVAAFPSDIHSPKGKGNEEYKGYFLVQELSKRIGMDLRQMEYHSLFLNSTGEVPPPFVLSEILKQDKEFDRSYVSHCGTIPLYSPGELLKETRGYNEIIVMGNKLNLPNQRLKGTLLLFEKRDLDKGTFLTKEVIAKLKEMETLTGGRLKLVLVDSLSSVKYKHSVTGALNFLNSKLHELNAQIQALQEDCVEEKEKEKEMETTSEPQLSLFDLQQKVLRLRQKEKALLHLTQMEEDDPSLTENIVNSLEF